MYAIFTKEIIFDSAYIHRYNYQNRQTFLLDTL